MSVITEPAVRACSAQRRNRSTGSGSAPAGSKVSEGSLEPVSGAVWFTLTDRSVREPTAGLGGGSVEKPMRGDGQELDEVIAQGHLLLPIYVGVRTETQGKSAFRSQLG